MPAPAREVKISLFMYALHKDSSTLKNWPVTLLLCVASFKAFSYYFPSLFFVFAGPRQAQCKDHWSNWTVGRGDWGAMSKQVRINTVFHSVNFSNSSLSSRSVCRPRKQRAVLINNATETCTFCLLSKYCIQAVRRGRRDRLITQLWSSLVYCTNSLLWFRLVSSGGPLILLLS